jgi:hypothetical protein
MLALVTGRNLGFEYIEMVFMSIHAEHSSIISV